jgi:hypothetical protein
MSNFNQSEMSEDGLAPSVEPVDLENVWKLTQDMPLVPRHRSMSYPSENTPESGVLEQMSRPFGIGLHSSVYWPITLSC